MNNEDLCLGGVTLRSLLESKDFLTMPARPKVSEKEEKDSCSMFCDATAAFLGPNLWDKTLSDFKLEYVDLDDILGTNVSEEIHRKTIENNPNCAENPNLIQLTPQVSPHLQENVADQLVTQRFLGLQSHNHALSFVPRPLPSQTEQRLIQNISPSSSPQRVPSTVSCDLSEDPIRLNFPTDRKLPSKELPLAIIPHPESYDPSVIPLQDDVLKPQPMVRKSQKHFVPDSLKDDKYWARRRKNNQAAKRSREARRVKENQIVLRASFLEKENNALKDEVLRLKTENEMLKSQLKKMKQ